MLYEIFYWLFNMSIAASLSGLIILGVRSIKKIPRRVTVFLWLIPFIRMLLPIGLSSKYSLMSLITRLGTKITTVYKASEPIIDNPDNAFPVSYMNFISVADSYNPITFEENLLFNVFAVAGAIWMVIFLAIIIAIGVIYFSTLKEMKSATHCRDNIYISEKLLSPAVYGIVKPKIILPEGFRDNDLTYILAHERAHIKRGDNLWRIVCFGVTALHWFNPLCWVFLKFFLADLELSCDESVVSKLNESEKKEYAMALLDSGRKTNIFVSAFGGARVRTRIENILSFKKVTAFSLLGFISLVIAICYILLTNTV